MRPARRLAAIGAAAALAAALSGCALLPRPAVRPMPTLLDRSACTAQADTLLVLLPGRGMAPGEFAREGFVAAVQERGLAVDVLQADAHIGYYEQQQIAPRLRADVIAPAQARGYRAVWLVGISLGGFGALVYAGARPADLAGVVALAPYLGERDASDEVAAAGGLGNWTPPAASVAERDLGRRLWRSLQPYAAAKNPPGLPPLYLGYGVDDRFALSHRLLAAALPGERVYTAVGGHDWPEWRQLWRSMLADLPLPRCAGQQGRFAPPSTLQFLRVAPRA